jgi:CBS domain-containing protein
MRSVAEILATKTSPTIHTTTPETSVYDAMQRMAEQRIGALLVMNGEALVGIVTERDYARKIALKSRRSKRTAVRDIMTSPVTCVGPEQTSDDCMALMAKHQFRHLPVVEQGRVLGMVSIRDLVDEIVADRRLLVDELEQAIVSTQNKH